ncbi:hypothetical protein HCG51_03225 [Tolypothrix sp. PCC 7910]|uniref:hypothetical protein n=1 Tax=Tolypothrix sp. PCC 7910 TaxID=2099387 RepID=UPI001427800C|nr:hypothetical protein [Tolypothrix sp. PCC 7910]QIR35863.1 hypothetical protein HCG51_03225 [Tolypothrix sp. PCC 7910]
MVYKSENPPEPTGNESSVEKGKKEYEDARKLAAQKKYTAAREKFQSTINILTPCEKIDPEAADYLNRAKEELKSLSQSPSV